MIERKKKNLIQSLLVILSYFLYTSLFYRVLSVFFGTGIYDSDVWGFVADVVFLIVIIFCYRTSLMENLKDLRIHTWKKFGDGIKWMIIAIVSQTAIIAMLSSIMPSLSNNDASLLELPFYYRIFKTMVFSIIAEEIVYRKCVRDIISDKVLIVIISSLFYAFMNIAYSNVHGMEVLTFLPYFVSSMALSYLYIKYDNIVLVMIVKFIYQLLPLTVMILGLS